MQEEQKAISFDEEIRREAHAFLEKMKDGTINTAYGDEMFKKLSAAALNSWFPNSEPSQENVEQFSRRAHWHLNNIFSLKIQQQRLENDIALCLNLTAKEFFGNAKHSTPQNQFAVLVFNEAGLLLNKANEATLDNADQSYAARAFHRLAEAFLRKIPKENWPTEDISAIAQTADTHFGKTYAHSLQVHMAQLMSVCLQKAFGDEERKVEFPILEYDFISEPDEEELEDYGTGFDPLRLHKFTQRIFKNALFRVRGDDSEIQYAIREFDEAIFPEWKTREDYINQMDVWGWPVEIRERAITSFDKTLAEQREQTPEIVANLLQQRRNAMLNGHAETIFQTFIAYVDHGMRCGISATLFLALHYADAHYLEISDASEKEIDKARPTLTDLKKHVADYFADWLTRPLTTKQRPRKEQHYALPDFDKHFKALYPKVNKAKKCYTRNKDDDNWHGLVKLAVIDMPDDLIERLGVNVKARNNQPRSIALEWAARLSGEAEGYPNNRYDAAYLSNRLSKQKQQS